MEVNQVFKADGGKLQPTLMTKGIPDALESVVAVFGYGAQKYEAHSWKRVDPARYEDALLRHVLKWQAGEAVDEESGLDHLAHMAWNCLTLLQSKIDAIKPITEGKPWLNYNEPPTAHKEVKDDFVSEPVETSEQGGDQVYPSILRGIEEVLRGQPLPGYHIVSNPGWQDCKSGDLNGWWNDLYARDNPTAARTGY